MVLMVPVSAFAAVVAMAGPQRLAAESSVQEAADDLAMFTVAWRDGHQLEEGPLPAFFERCDERSETHQDELDQLAAVLDDLVNVQNLPSTDQLVIDATAAIPAREAEIREWTEVCNRLFEALLRDLGNLGVDMGSLRGSYSDSLKESSMNGTCSVSAHTSESACTGAGGTWFELPCLVAVGRLAPRADVVVSDAAHVALAADWQDAGWAAAQVWPDGLPMAAESIGRLSKYDTTDTSSLPRCGRQLVVLDSQGRPVWAGNPDAPSRQMVQSVPRSVLAG